MSSDDEKSRAQQAQKLEALGQFAGGIAHDFNNILSIIEGYAGIAAKQLKDGTLSPDLLQKILAATERGAGLTRQLLAFSRQKIGLDETLDLCRELTEMQVLLKPALGEKIAFTLTLPDTPVFIRAPRDSMTQVILNLVLNARDAMPGGGALHITCMPGRLTVIDTGEGIAPDILPRIFDPFFTTKEHGRGTGLGLSVVYGIVDQIGARISVQSQPGQGARFDIDFTPAPHPHHVLRPQGETPALKGRTIMIAEDEPELGDVLALVFSGAGMKVLQASNGNHALDLQRRHGAGIDFLLTDVVMPGMDGVKLGEAFRTESPGTNVVYMSGYPFVEVPAGADFVAKPLREDLVLEVLRRALLRREERLEKGEKNEE